MEPAPSAADVVQKLLTEVRLLRVENQRLGAAFEELRAKVGRPDPRLDSQEAEIQRLRGELAAAREQRDVVSEGLRQAVVRLRAALLDRK